VFCGFFHAGSHGEIIFFTGVLFPLHVNKLNKNPVKPGMERPSAAILLSKKIRQSGC